MAALVLPGPVLAACPVAADLERGIELRFEDGATETHFALPAGRTRVVWTDQGDGFTDVLSAGGLPVAFWEGAEIGVEDTTHRVFADHAVDQAPTPGLRLQLTGVDIAHFSSQEEYSYEIAWAEAFQAVEIENCSYKTLSGTMVERLAGDTDPWAMQMLYLPELGIMSLIGSGASIAEIEITPIASIQAR